jgi:hypothetical protein
MKGTAEECRETVQNIAIGFAVGFAASQVRK